MHWGDVFGIDTLKVQISDKLTKCINITKLFVEIKNSKAPDKTIIVRKANTNILICEESGANINYQWGYIEKQSKKIHDILGGNGRYVQLDHDIDTAKYIYYLKTSFQGCKTISYFNYKLPLNLMALNNEDLTIDLYPNPCNRKFKLKSKEGNISELKIYDFSGRRIPYSFDPLDNLYKLNDDVPDGLYYVIFTFNNSILITKPIIIQ
jgi:hypothetical protein